MLLIRKNTLFRPQKQLVKGCPVLSAHLIVDKNIHAGVSRLQEEANMNKHYEQLSVVPFY